MNNRKKGLIVVYDPHNLLQFLWYYATYGKDCEWTALCLPNGFKGEYMGAYCERCGIFERVIRKNDDFTEAPAGKKAVIFAQLAANALIGNQAGFTKRFLKRYEIDADKYEKLIVMTDVGLISGMILSLGKSKDVIVLEDGTGDYIPRSFSQILKRIGSFDAWQWFFLAWMGYSSPGHIFPLKTTRYAEKFCSKPEEMRYRDYRVMRRLYDFEKTDIPLYQQLTQKAFGEIDLQAIREGELFFFTVPVTDFTPESGPYVRRIMAYVNGMIEEGKRKVVVKKHPRDAQVYPFSEKAEIYEVDSSVPSEVMLPFLKDKTLVFFSHCSTLLNLEDVNRIVMLNMPDLAELSKYDAAYPSRETIEEHMRLCGLKNYTVIEI